MAAHSRQEHRISLASVAACVITFSVAVAAAGAGILTMAGDTDGSGTPDATPQLVSTYYDDCDQAESAGVAPMSAGEPGYRTVLDPDANGLACE